jgi:hypothetical protein
MAVYKIVGIERLHMCHGAVRLRGFKLDGIIGCVDPFVDGAFLPACLRELVDNENCVLAGKEKEFFAREITWAEDQIGKNLKCDDLVYSAFATQGNVSVED